MFIVQSTEDPAYRVVSMLPSKLKDEVHAKIIVAGISTTCSQKIHNQLAQPILPELLENSTTKVIEYGRKHVEGRDGDSTDVGKSGDPFSRLLGPKEEEEEGVNNMKLALEKPKTFSTMMIMEFRIMIHPEQQGRICCLCQQGDKAMLGQELCRQRHKSDGFWNEMQRISFCAA
ncbi:uncharacterized protein [Malus domestica]|uniref:uncharacterized protein n=1 Tax=Malus domestica TaxID=3750 RepID=UPI003976EAE3